MLRHAFLAALGGCITFLLPALAFSQSKPVAFTGATIYPVSSEPIASGVLVIQDGRIVAVGPAATTGVEAGADVRDVTGRVIIPGLVDTHSHIGVYPRPLVGANRDANETTDPVNPSMRALDAIWPADPGIRQALSGGITTANIMPGSGNVVGGQTAYVKLRGSTVEEMWIKDRDGTPVLGGMKMANGENPKRTYGSRDKAPMTRMAVAQLERQLFIDAQQYEREQDEYRRKVANGDDVEPPARDLRLEPMLEVLQGKRIVHHHTHRADDIATVIRIRDEFGHRVVIQHGTEAYLLADLLAEKGIWVSAIVVDSPGGKHEAIALDLQGPALLEAAGVKVALHTDDFITHSRLFLRSGALAVRGGMSEAGALAALTQNGADMMDLGERLGSLEPGKDADFVLLSGPPFATRTRVLETWIDGERVWDARDPRDLRYQTGGFALAGRAQ